MAVNGVVGAKYLLTRINNSYKDEDCVHAVVINLIRNCVGGDSYYRTAGCTELWNSYTKYSEGNKYRHITERLTLSEAKAKGMLIGDLPVIFDDKTGKCEHIAYYMGGIGGYECVHSSASKGIVCGTTLKNGFTHVLRHKYITGVSCDEIIMDSQENKKEVSVMNVLYYAKVATGGGALNLRSEPRIKKNVICEIPFATELAVIEETNNEWAKVEFNGKCGYVSKKYLAYTHTDSKEQNANVENEDGSIVEINDSLFEGTWGLFIPCDSKIAANSIAKHFSYGLVIKVNLDD